MRIQPYTVGSYVHVMKRGSRGLSITHDEKDRWRFLKLLYYMNDHYKSEFWERDIKSLSLFERPENWPERKPLVKILAWVLMPNHFHLLLQEIIDGGVAKFMQKLCGSMSLHFNMKYDSKGSIFQGAYKSRSIVTDDYLRYLAAYIMVKNVFELYPGTQSSIEASFETMWQWALTYPFSSLQNYGSKCSSPLIEKDILGELFPSPKIFKDFSFDVILGRKGFIETVDLDLE